MKLVVSHTFGDGCSWSSSESIPVEYESAEAFLVDFEKVIKETKALYNKARDEDSGRVPSTDLYFVKFAGHTWDWSDFYSLDSRSDYAGPDRVETLEDWFENNKDEIGEF